MSKKEELCVSSEALQRIIKISCLKRLKNVYLVRGTHTEINNLSADAFDMLAEIKADPLMILIYANNIEPCIEQNTEFDADKCFMIEFDNFSIFMMVVQSEEKSISKDFGLIFDLIPHKFDKIE